MKKKIFLTETELILLVKKIILEDETIDIDFELPSKELKNKESLNSKTIVVFISGKNTGTYKPTKEQVEIFSQGLSGDKKIYAYGVENYKKGIKMINHLEESTGITPWVVLFSLSCKYSSDFANAMSDKTKLIINEPPSGFKESIVSAYKSGVPAKNINLGLYPGVGSLIVKEIKDASRTPKGKNHWDSLVYVAGFIP